MFSHVSWVSYGKIGLTTITVIQDLAWGTTKFFLQKELVSVWSSKLPEPRQSCTLLSKLICPTAFKKTQHTMSHWYSAIHISWLVASHDTHNGKRWLNSNPQAIGKNGCVGLFLFTRWGVTWPWHRLETHCHEHIEICKSTTRCFHVYYVENII